MQSVQETNTPGRQVSRLPLFRTPSSHTTPINPGSSTTVAYQRPRPGRCQRLIRLLSTQLLVLPSPRRWTAEISTSHALKLTSVLLYTFTYLVCCLTIEHIGNAETQMATGKKRLQPNGDSIVEATMDVQHVANAVLHIVNLPLEVTVLHMNIMASTMPFVGRG